MGWRGYIHLPRKAVFFWSQKAACTSLFGTLTQDITPRPQRGDYFHVHSDPFSVCDAAIRENGLEKIIIARHPVIRCISAYLNKFVIYKGNWLTQREQLEIFAQKLFDTHCELRNRESNENRLSFEDFLDTVEYLHANRLRPQKPINGHWETQVPGYFPDIGFQYDTIVHVEHFQSEMTSLCKRLQMPFTPRWENRTDLKREATHYLGNIPANQLVNQPFSYASFINDDILARIGHLYAIDFEYLGYPLHPD